MQCLHPLCLTALCCWGTLCWHLAAHVYELNRIGRCMSKVCQTFKAVTYLQDDPLTQTLDKLFSPELRDTVTEVPVNIPQGVKDICSELEKEEGIESVVLGRQVEEKRVVSQVRATSAFQFEPRHTHAIAFNCPVVLFKAILCCFS